MYINLARVLPMYRGKYLTFQLHMHSETYTCNDLYQKIITGHAVSFLKHYRAKLLAHLQAIQPDGVVQLDI